MPNRDQTLELDAAWTEACLARYRLALGALDWASIDSKSKVSLVSPLNMIAWDIERNETRIVERKGARIS